MSTCSALSTAFPKITCLYGIPIPTKRRAVYVLQSQGATLQFQLLDGNGNPVDLTSCGFGMSPTGVVRFGFKETIRRQPSDITYVNGTVVDVPTGLISVTLPANIVMKPAVLDGQLAVFTASPDAPTNTPMTYGNMFYVWVDRGLFPTQNVGMNGLFGLDEARVYMRDNGGEENLLISVTEYDLAEICQAAAMGVRYWNEAQPPINLFYHTDDYPYRDYWIRHVGGYMMKMAARRFLRNTLPYQAAGVSVDDQNKFKEYDAMGQQLMDEYKEWVKQKKTQLNCEAAMTSSGSAYGLYDFWP